MPTPSSGLSEAVGFWVSGVEVIIVSVMGTAAPNAVCAEEMACPSAQWMPAASGREFSTD
ncbi:hypothetical protein HHA02_28270 [Cobetia marina]|nr:hypothetical protein HHA02_28270 [Cobetia marina]